MVDHKRWQRGENAFMRHNGIAITRVSMQEAESCLNIRPESLNLYGKLHGGAYFTLADTASGALARADGRAYVTMDSHLTFIRPALSGLLCYPLGLGLIGAWMGTFGDQAVRFVMSFIRFHKGSWTKLKL